MRKRIFLILGVIFCALAISPTTYACDPLGCLLGGHKQDALILGEVVSETDDTLDVKIIFVFPQNQDQSLSNEKIITVGEITTAINFTEEDAEKIKVGKKYLMSLNAGNDLYIPAWGIFEIAGSSYADAKIVKKKSIDDETLEIFMRSGGKEKDFAFDHSGDEAVLIRNGARQVPKVKNVDMYWYGAGIGALALLAGVILVSRKKR